VDAEAGNVLRINAAFALRLHSMIYLFSFPLIHAEKGRRFHCKSYVVFAVSVDILSSLPAKRLCLIVFIEGEALGVRKLACAFVISDLYSEEL
jgi:hypothetical protein